MTEDSTNDIKKQDVILLVEDDPALRKMLKNGLEMEGFMVIEASARLSALNALKKHDDIQAIILDLGLPPNEHTTEEGLGVIQEVMSEQYMSKIIVLTGQDEEQSALEAIREGAFDFLSKPADFGEILRAVNRAVLFHRKEKDMSEEGMTRLQFSARFSDGLKAIREEAEEKLIRKTLKQTRFNVYQTASRLGLKRESIYYFIKKFGITRDND